MEEAGERRTETSSCCPFSGVGREAMVCAADPAAEAAIIAVAGAPTYERNERGCRAWYVWFIIAVLIGAVAGHPFFPDFLFWALAALAMLAAVRVVARHLAVCGREYQWVELARG